MLLSRMLTLRSMRSRPVRVLLSAFGIILGVAGILAISITNSNALDSITRLLKNTSGKASLVIMHVNNEQGMDINTLLGFHNIAGIQAAIPLVKVNTAIAGDLPDEQAAINFFGTTGGGLLLFGIDPAMDLLGRDYQITAGQFLSREKGVYEIVLVESYAEDKELKLGDRVEILTPTGIVRLKLVGLMAEEGPGRNNNGAFGILPLQTAQLLFSRAGEIDQIDIVVEDKYSSQESIDSIRLDLANRLGKDYSVIYPANQGQRMVQMLGNYQIGLNFLSGVALFVGAFLIYNAFAMTVVERTREFGMLRTIGMMSRQIMVQVLIEAGILGVGGSLLGAGLGIVMARGLSQIMAIVLGQELRELQIPLSSLFQSIGIGIVVTILAAVIPAWQAGRISPIAALRIRGKTREDWLLHSSWKYGLVLLAISMVILFWNPFSYDVQFRLGSLTVFLMFLGATLVIPASVGHWERLTRGLVRRLYGTSGAIGSRNIERSLLRSTLTIVALLIGVAMILIVRSITESFASDLKTWMNAYLGGDLYINSSVALRSEIGRRLETVEGVQAVAPVRYFPVEWLKPDGAFETLNFMALEPVSYSAVTNFVFSDSNIDQASAFQRLGAGDAVFISSVLAEKYGLKPGEQIYLQTRQSIQPFEIAAVIVDFYNQGMVVNGNWNDMRRYFKINDASMFLVRVEEGRSLAQMEELIDKLYGKRYQLVIERNDSLRSRIFSLMDQAFSMFDVMALIAMAVGVFGVINTLTMNILERMREIGMLRAIGMTRQQIIKMILAESAIMGMMGGIFGLVFGIFLSRIFLLGMTAMSGYKLDFVVPWQGVVAGITIALLVSQLAAYLPAKRAAKTHVLEAIRYE